MVSADFVNMAEGITSNGVIAADLADDGVSSAGREKRS